MKNWDGLESLGVKLNSTVDWRLLWKLDSEERQWCRLVERRPGTQGKGMRKSAEAGICKICLRSGKLTSLVRVGVQVGKGPECQFKNIGSGKSCGVFDMFRGVFQQDRSWGLHAGSLEKEDWVAFRTVSSSFWSCLSTQLYIIVVFISYALSNVRNWIYEMANVLFIKT